MKHFISLLNICQRHLSVCLKGTFLPIINGNYSYRQCPLQSVHYFQCKNCFTLAVFQDINRYIFVWLNRALMLTALTSCKHLLSVNFYPISNFKDFSRLVKKFKDFSRGQPKCKGFSIPYEPIESYTMNKPRAVTAIIFVVCDFFSCCLNLCLIGCGMINIPEIIIILGFCGLISCTARQSDKNYGGSLSYITNKIKIPCITKLSLLITSEHIFC